MRRLQLKFPSQIRISGWDFGSSARAMNQAGGKDSLMTYENESIPQAEIGKGLNSTTERKSMSTKTTIKRIALVAVSALGLGVLTSVAPASAANYTANAAVSSTAVSASVADSALRLNTPTTILVKITGPAVTRYTNETGTVTTGGYVGTEYVNPNLRVLSAPAGSTATYTPATTSGTGTAGAAFGFAADSANGIAAISATGAGAITTPVRIGSTIAASANDTAYYAAINFTPDKVGTYTFTFWDDADGNGNVNAVAGTVEPSTTLVLTVTDAIASLTTTTVINNGSTIDSTNYGAIVKIVAKDAAGNPTSPSPAETIKVAVSGSAVFSKTYGSGAMASASGTNTTYLTSADFDSNGAAWLGVVDGTEETVSVTPSLVGGLTTASATVSTVTFVTPTSYIATPGNGNVAVATGVTSTLGSGAYYKVATNGSYSLSATAAAASKKVAVGIKEVSGAVYGNPAIRAVTVLSSGTTSLVSLSGTIASSSPNSSILYFVGTASAATNPDVTAAATSASAVGVYTNLKKSAAADITFTPTAARIATGGTATFKVTVADQFGNGRAGLAVAPAITGRNAATAMSSAITNADGIATLTLTDASTSTSSLTDAISFTVKGGLGVDVTSSTNAAVTWVAGLAASDVLVTTPNTTENVANSAIVRSDIAAGKAGATAGKVAVTAEVDDANGVAVAGFPVTFTVSGTGAAITSTTQSVYTDSTGVATAYVYAWLAGTYTVTATAGGKSGSGSITFNQQTAAEARTIEASSNGNAVIATVKDRFGNPVANSVVYATITSGSGYFADSTVKKNLTTGVNGTATFIVTGGSASVSVSTINPDGDGTAVDQTTASAGKVAYATTPVAFTAYVAGNSTTDEVGVGSTYSPVGVSTASADATPVSSSDSVDAANEATDAANAATDAANAAAEAADAATAAAQDAQAAVAELATQVAALIAGIKAQITTLTNLVIKIQKKVKA